MPTLVSYIAISNKDFFITIFQHLTLIGSDLNDIWPQEGLINLAQIICQ